MESFPETFTWPVTIMLVPGCSLFTAPTVIQSERVRDNNPIIPIKRKCASIRSASCLQPHSHLGGLSCRAPHQLLFIINRPPFPHFHSHMTRTRIASPRGGTVIRWPRTNPKQKIPNCITAPLPSPHLGRCNCSCFVKLDSMENTNTLARACNQPFNPIRRQSQAKLC